MKCQEEPDDNEGMVGVGLFVYGIFCVCPALEMAGFGLGMKFSLKDALIIAAIGGSVSGLLLHPRPALAGIIGGLIAGMCSLLAVYYYSQGRERILILEVMAIQLISSIPGVIVGSLVHGAIRGFRSDRQPSSSEAGDTSSLSPLPCPQCGFISEYDGENCSECGYSAPKTDQPLDGPPKLKETGELPPSSV